MAGIDAQGRTSLHYAAMTSDVPPPDAAASG
jgi:hypothetical protein